MVRHWGWSFLEGKLSIVAGFFVVASLVDGAGTVAFPVVVAGLVPSFMWANERLLQLPNYVLYRSAGSHASTVRARAPEPPVGTSIGGAK